jgi:transposase
MDVYPPEVEERMRRFYHSLNEKERRLFAGLEALRIGHGGRNYIAEVLGCSRNTVSKGACEMSNSPQKQVEQFIRQPGGGRKSYEVTWGAELDEKFLEVLRDHTAGDPMDETVRWTNMTPQNISQVLQKDHGFKISKSVVRKLLKKHNYRRRKAQRRLSLKSEIKNRNEQFENIARIKAEFEMAGNPIISMDTKKKEDSGNFYRDGHLYTREELKTYDHDFKSYAEGTVVPHSFYDLKLNVGYVQMGVSHDTSEFSCDSFRHWWYTHGQQNYPGASAILILCDGGGSNSSLHYIFKQDLQTLADEIGVEIRIAHYPPYCSKYNPIEHRLFPHITRECQGVIFTSIEVVQELIEKTNTKAGLKAFVHVINKVYEIGRKVAAGFKENMRIVFDDLLPRFNYRAVPLNL